MLQQAGWLLVIAGFCLGARPVRPDGAWLLLSGLFLLEIGMAFCMVWGKEDFCHGSEFPVSGRLP
jgi:hypothetical protein